MEFIGLLLLSVSLSVDALTIGTSCAIGGIKTSWRARIVICLISFLIMGISVVCGEWLAKLITPDVSKLIGCGMLCLLGIYIISGAIGKTKNRREKKSVTLVLKPLGITVNIIKNPISCDIDKSNSIDMREACYIGTALSVDSVGAGVSMGVGGMNALSVAGMCSLCQLIFLCVGLFLGARLRNTEKIPQKAFTIISGMIIILISIVKVFV